MALANPQINPNYIPRSVLFAPAEIMTVKISPDAKHLAYVKGSATGVMNIFITKTEDWQDPGALRQITHFTAPEIYRFYWTDDAKHIVFLQDTNGSKTYDLYTVNIESGKLINHTADFKGTAKIFKISGSKVALGINDRNPQYHDIFILETKDGTLKRAYENDSFSRFTLDEDLKIVFKQEIHNDGSIDIYKDQQKFMVLTPEDAFHTRFIGVYNNTLYYLDTRTSDTTTLKALNLQNNQETQIAHNNKSDIGEIVFVNGKPVMYATEWLKKEWHDLSGTHSKFLQQKFNGNFQVVNQADNMWIIRTSDPKHIGASFYLYNNANNELKPLHIADTNAKLADMLPFEFKTRDGLLLTAYITLPNQMSSVAELKSPVPLIVFPHGGPFQARDHWTYHPYHQWLASRGYAVLSVNFRLSSGLGKNLVNAGNGEWGGKALLDLLDGVQWCIDKGITTKNKVGIMGGSYGGYATLAALAFTPDAFVVGVDIVGPSSLITVMERVPKYWDFPAYPLADDELFFTRGAFIKSMGGSPDDAAGREFLASRSPLNFAAQINKPLLIIQGDNDPIVTKIESEQIFMQLQKLNKKSCFMSFPDEGHQFRLYANIDVSLAAAEKWLHDALGGEYEPSDTELSKASSANIQSNA